MPIESKLGATALVGLSALLLACPVGYYQRQEKDVDRTPTVDTGAGATIIYPGQTAPALPANPRLGEPGSGAPAGASGGAGSAQPPYAAPQVAQPPPEYGQPYESGARTSSGAPSGGGVSMIGGSEIDEKTHRKVQAEPVIWKYIALPFALAAAPFKYAADTMRGEPEAGPPVPNTAPAERQPPPGPPPEDYETAALRNMERELARREASAAPPQAQAAPYSPRYPSPHAAPRSNGASAIADELAALRTRASGTQAGPPYGAAPQAAPGYAAPDARHGAQAAPAASGRVDRNADGRTDQWIYRSNGEIEREEYDENFDGRPDRILHYDRTTHQVVDLEEDTDHDGSPDSWTSLRDGAVVRRRTDSDADGHVDTWSFYRDGTLTRLERDSTGDGFRDHVAYYRDGRIDREEKDGDGDGRLDLVTYYDTDEKVVRVEEDTDGDGRMDVISHYEGGRLSRRELLDASILGAGEPSGVEHN